MWLIKRKTVIRPVVSYLYDARERKEQIAAIWKIYNK